VPDCHRHDSLRLCPVNRPNSLIFGGTVAAAPLMLTNNESTDLRSWVLANLVWLCEAWTMAKKRTKLDKSQRQADQLEKRAETRPEQSPKKVPPSRT
jgi:hypothetical protein